MAIQTCELCQFTLNAVIILKHIFSILECGYLSEFALFCFGEELISVHLKEKVVTVLSTIQR